MKNKKTIIISAICIAFVFILTVGVIGGNYLLTHFIDNTNIVCAEQKFLSAEEAIEAMEVSEYEDNDTSLDYCPPYSLKYTFDYEDNTIVFYSYCDDYDGETSSDYAVRILKYNDDGTLSFSGGLADFCLEEPQLGEDYYYYTNIDTSNGKKSISFLYLPKDSDKEIFVDGEKAEKMAVSIDGREFYICYAISDKDTFLSNLFTPISERHSIEVK